MRNFNLADKMLRQIKLTCSYFKKVPVIIQIYCSVRQLLYSIALLQTVIKDIQMSSLSHQ